MTERAVTPIEWRHAHFFFLAAYACLFFYNNNHNYFPGSSPWPALGVSIGSALIIGSGLFFFPKRRELTALYVFCLTMIFLSFGHLINVLADFCGSFETNRFLQVLTFLYLVALALRICFIAGRKNWPLAPLNKYLTCAAFFLLVFQIILFVRLPTPLQEDHSPSPVPEKHPTKKANSPNLYVIVLDAYGRTDTLKEFFQFDNTGFLHELQSLGFSIGKNSTSNYFISALSISSMFNMDYVQNLQIRQPSSPADLMPLSEKIDRSWTRALLSGQGYLFATTPTLFPPLECPSADIHASNSFSFDSLFSNFLATTAIRPFCSFLSTHAKYRNFVLKNLENIPTLANGDAPVFAYIHLTIPHPPFVFSADGKAVGNNIPPTLNDGAELFETGFSKKEYIAGYRGQIAFSSREILESLRKLIAQDKSDPYIILLGDHGPRLLYGDKTKTPSELLSSCANLLAVRTPSGKAVPQENLTTPINAMRFVISKMTGEHLPPLPRRIYLSYSSDPYACEDVTPLLYPSEVTQ